jgi:anti-anti-sigma factor
VRRRNDVSIVRPHGELDLRELPFIDSTGLHLLAALQERARRDGFQLTLVAPAAPADKAIQVSGLGQTLPFVTAYDES